MKGKNLPDRNLTEMNDTDVGFLNFVAALTTALPDLCKRSEDDPQSPRLRVIYNPDKKRAEAGEILIGLGYVQDATKTSNN